jgi:hypothetical protein
MAVFKKTALVSPDIKEQRNKQLATEHKQCMQVFEEQPLTFGKHVDLTSAIQEQ